MLTAFGCTLIPVIDPIAPASWSETKQGLKSIADASSANPAKWRASSAASLEKRDGGMTILAATWRGETKNGGKRWAGKGARGSDRGRRTSHQSPPFPPHPTPRLDVVRRQFVVQCGEQRVVLLGVRHNLGHRPIKNLVFVLRLPPLDLRPQFGVDVFLDLLAFRGQGIRVILPRRRVGRRPQFGNRLVLPPLLPPLPRRPLARGGGGGGGEQGLGADVGLGGGEEEGRERRSCEGAPAPPPSPHAPTLHPIRICSHASCRAGRAGRPGRRRRRPRAR